MLALPARELAQDREKRPLGKVIAIFGSVGIATTLCYFLLASALATLPGISIAGASVIAYGLSAAISYYAHKYLSFASKRADTVAFPRFLVSTGLGLSIAFALPKLGESMGCPPHRRLCRDLCCRACHQLRHSQPLGLRATRQ